MRIEATIIAGIGAHPNIVQLLGTTADFTGPLAASAAATIRACCIRGGDRSNTLGIPAFHRNFSGMMLSLECSAFPREFLRGARIALQETRT